MKISDTMLRHYLGQITHSFFASNDEMPEDLSEFDSYMQTVRAMAETAGDTRWLQLGLQHLVNDPQADLGRYGAGLFPITADDIRQIIWHLLDRLDAPGGAAAPAIPITLEPMTGDEWRAHRAGLGA
jgi:hypothetical protein